MIKDKEWIGKDFVWWFGVVEDLKDPLNIGRVRVRCFGFHTDDPAVLPYTDLPWAQVLMPVTSASFSAIGTSATGLIEGSHVVGFFMDGDNAQMPMVMGSFPGVPTYQDTSKGFSDPNATYPKEFNYPDTPKLAYDRFLEDKVTEEKIRNRVEDVPMAARQTLTTAKNRSGVTYGEKDSGKTSPTDENRPPLVWSEPPNRGAMVSAYPDNHVTQTTSGHAFEVDDTDGCERIHEYHRTGTFYEIQPDGSRMTKVVNNDYEIVCTDKNVFVKGKCNLTVEGEARMYFKNNLIQEVAGDYHLTVHGDMLTKVVKNHATDILGNRSTQINGNQFERVSKNNSKIIVGNNSESVEGNTNINFNANKDEFVLGRSDRTVVGDDTQITFGHENIAASETLVIASKDYMKIRTESYLKSWSVGTWDHESGGNITITGGPNIYMNPD